MSGLGCGHRIAPVLEQLDSLAGVKASFTNHAGSIIRVSLDQPADSPQVAEQVLEVLNASNAKPVRLDDARSRDALANETWRDIERTSELSTIEFRTVSMNRLKKYAQDEKMSPEVAAQLVKIAEQTWDEQLSKVDPKVPPHKADWNDQCHSVALAFIENAKHVLTEKQAEQLKEMVEIELPK